MKDKLPLRIVVGNRRRVFDDEDSVGNVKIESVNHPRDNTIIKTEPPDEESDTVCDKESIVKEENVVHLYIQGEIKTEPTEIQEQENFVTKIWDTEVANVNRQFIPVQNVKLEPESCSLVPQVKEEPSLDFTVCDKYEESCKGGHINSNVKKKTITQSIQPRLCKSMKTTEADNRIESSKIPSGIGNSCLENVEINTSVLCKDIKLKLLELKISQTKFADCIIGCTRGTLCNILNNPKPWSELTPKGCTTYRLMWEWLKKSDSDKINFLNSPENCKVRTKNRKPRVVFSPLQRQVLKEIFKRTQKPSKDMIKTISLQLNLQYSTVNNFFINARCRRHYRDDSFDNLNHSHVKRMSHNKNNMTEL